MLDLDVLDGVGEHRDGAVVIQMELAGGGEGGGKEDWYADAKQSDRYSLCDVAVDEDIARI